MNRLAALLAAVLLAAALPAAAQTYPSRPVRIVVPFPPGGATDILGRLVAAKVQELWGQPVIIDNRPGAGTVVGTEAVAKAAPDGYTLGFVITAHVINPSLRTGMPYDTLKDLAGVTLVSTQDLVMAVHPSVEARTLAELIALAKKSPGKLAYATPGSGTAMHLAMELLKAKAGIDVVHVPYKGGAPAEQDVMGGRVPILVDVLYAAQPFIQAGRLRALAVLGPQRAPNHPYPAAVETVPGASAVSIVGIVAPAAVDNELLRKISADFARALKSPDLAERMRQMGLEPVGSTPEQFDAFIRAEIEKWAPVVKATGAKSD